MTRAVTPAGGSPTTSPDGAETESDAPEWEPGWTWQVVALAALILVGMGYLLEASQLPAGTADDPGIGMYPRVAGGLFVGSLIIALARHLLRRHRIESSGHFSPRPLIILATVLSYVVVAPVVGHIVAAALITAVVLRATGRRPWWQVAVVTVLASLGSYLLIVTVLGMSLPAGELGLEF